jgi:hypothetical protein
MIRNFRVRTKLEDLEIVSKAVLQPCRVPVTFEERS